MDQHSDYREQVRAGQEAQSILDSVVFQDALRLEREELFQQWLQSTDSTQREALHSAARNLDATESALRKIISRGQYAAKVLSQAEADLPD